MRKEPIHIPNAIHPFGVLLTVDPQRFVICSPSENCAAHWGRAASELVVTPVPDRLDSEDLPRLSLYLQGAHLEDSSPLVVSIRTPDGLGFH